MKATILAAALLLVMSACAAVLPHEPIVQASGAGVEESFARPVSATAAPTQSASGPGTELTTSAPAATAKVKGRGK